MINEIEIITKIRIGRIKIDTMIRMIRNVPAKIAETTVIIKVKNPGIRFIAVSYII